jgi:hypothetical protein
MLAVDLRHRLADIEQRVALIRTRLSTLEEAMLAADPDPTPRRPKLASCPACGANGAACETLRWLRGQRCCARCPGDHDRPNERNAR